MWLLLKGEEGEDFRNKKSRVTTIDTGHGKGKD